MSFLTHSQLVAIKSARAKGWSRTFILETPGAAAASPDYYEGATAIATQEELHGDWVDREELDRRGSQGGMTVNADVLLNTDIDYFSKFSADGVRVVIEGVRYSVISASTSPDSGDCVVAGKKVV